jgi:hypothetical protein
MTCPKCSSQNIRISRHSHWNDVFYRIQGEQPYRCRSCRHRFYASLSALPASRQSGHHTIPIMSAWRRKHILRRVIILAIFATCFYIFWLYLRYITTDRVPSNGSGATPASVMNSTRQAT